MSTIYDVDMKVLGKQLLPPDKRGTRMQAWINALLSPLQYVRDLYLGSFKDGSTAPQFAAGSYNKGDRVVYYLSVYESLVAGNTTLPTDQTKWVRVQQNFIGVSERAQYNGQRLVLEYALNKRFGTQFRQPPLQSDIFISLNARSVAAFRAAGVESISSTVYGSSSSEFIINNYSFSAQNNFTINIPLAVYNAIDPTPSNIDGVVRNFVNNYIPAGILYLIATY